MLDNNMTQNVLHNWGNIFLMAIFFTVLPRASRTKSLWWSFFANIVNNVKLLIFFAKKSHHKCLTVFQKRLCCL